MIFRKSHPLRLLGPVTLALVAISVPGTNGPEGAQAVAVQPAAATAPAHKARHGGHTNGFTMRNNSEGPVDVFAWVASSGSADVCRSFGLAVVDRVTGETIRTLSLAKARPRRVARIAPGETARYNARVQLLSNSGPAAGGAALAGDCSVEARWSLAPPR